MVFSVVSIWVLDGFSTLSLSLLSLRSWVSLTTVRYFNTLKLVPSAIHMVPDRNSHLLRGLAQGIKLVYNPFKPRTCVLVSHKSAFGSGTKPDLDWGPNSTWVWIPSDPESLYFVQYQVMIKYRGWYPRPNRILVWEQITHLWRPNPHFVDVMTQFNLIWINLPLSMVLLIFITNMESELVCTKSLIQGVFEQPFQGSQHKTMWSNNRGWDQTLFGSRKKPYFGD